MRLFNTLNRSIEAFSAAGEVGLYVCGVTPYDTTHVGHARTYLVFDVLVRHLLHAGHRVHYVQNITDVDESILQRAAELVEPYDRLGDRYIAVYLEDVAALGMVPAATYPRASEAIPEMQQFISRLLDKGHAYEANGDVFFSVESVEGYGRLCRLDRAAMLEIEARQDGSTVGDPRKRDPLDFVLWRRSEAPPSWDSPWGRGRPGWHIECSTLGLEHLGPQIDIHGGGDDLVFPHHEAEIAQSEAVTGVRPFVRFWVHVAMARLDGAKMSKSKGNMVFVHDLLKRHSADALRLYLLSTHYRAPLDFDERELATASALAAKLSRAAHAPARPAGAGHRAVEEGFEAFVAALEDDLDTPRAIGVLADLAGAITSETEAAYEARRAVRALAVRLGLSLEGNRP